MEALFKIADVVPYFIVHGNHEKQHRHDKSGRRIDETSTKTVNFI